MIDWFTVFAQLINFAILVWLMKRFLYQPILDAIDAREKRIAAELQDAATQQADARRERDTYHHKNEAFEAQRAARLGEVTQEARAERQRLFEEARQAAEALRARRQEALRADARQLNQALVRQTQQEVFAITRRVLADLATASLEERLCQVFIRRLDEMDASARQRLGEALATAANPALVRSAFELPEAQRVAIKHALDETFVVDVALRFETAPELISGIELSVNGQKVAWSIDEYLASLERGVGELLNEQIMAEAKPKVTEAKVSDPQTRPS